MAEPCGDDMSLLLLVVVALAAQEVGELAAEAGHELAVGDLVVIFRVGEEDAEDGAPAIAAAMALDGP